MCNLRFFIHIPAIITNKFHFANNRHGGGHCDEAYERLLHSLNRTAHQEKIRLKSNKSEQNRAIFYAIDEKTAFLIKIFKNIFAYWLQIIIFASSSYLLRP